MAAGVTLAASLVLGAFLAAAGPVEVHGESDVFVSGGVALAWAVLRGATEAETLVVVRIVPRGGAWATVSAEAVDPFSRERRPALSRQPLAGGVEIRRSRASFSDHPRLEVHFHPDGGGAERPGLTVFFLGVPDTTPEFESEASLAGHLGSALSRARPSR